MRKIISEFELLDWVLVAVMVCVFGFIVISAISGICSMAEAGGAA